ncbi:MAG: hypothetical protein AAF567_07105 [Actinomycetota bacterium]
MRAERDIAIASTEYGTVDHAQKYRSTAGSQLSMDPAALMGFAGGMHAKRFLEGKQPSGT